MTHGPSPHGFPPPTKTHTNHHTRAHAAPWEASLNTCGDPKSNVATDIPARFASIRAQGFSTILLWGAEYWLWRADNGDYSWLDVVNGILAANATAPPVSV